MARKRTSSRTGGFFYGLRYRIGEYLLRAFVVVSPWIPYRLLVWYTSLCAWVTFVAFWKYRKRMEENLSIAMAEEFPTEIDRRGLIWRAWKNFSRGVLETSVVMHFTREQIVSTVSVEGEDHLKRALARGKGVIALSAHLGSFTMIGARLAAAGYPFSVVVKQPGDKRFARLIDAYRAQIGIKTIPAKPRREAVRGILRALRENGVVLMIADEFKSGGIMVNFMGQRSPAPRGPATLALRTGAATLPMFATRSADGSVVLTIRPEVELIQTPELENSVVANTALFTRHLEDMIRRYPDQWNWLGFPRDGRLRGSEIRQSEMASRSDADLI